MEIRKVQRTGDMHYLYLPTSWCKKHHITSASRINLKEDNTGALTISPTETKQVLKHISIKINEEDEELINRLIVACYMNPLGSFKIQLDKEMTATKLLNQKNLVSLESVEIEKKTITCESNVMLTDPGLLLKTMVKKIKNLIVVMDQHYNEELIHRYEEEIDRSKLLIQKSIISYMTQSVPVNLKMIDLYYISLITTDLERAVDHIIKLKKNDKPFLRQTVKVIEVLKRMIDSLGQKEMKEIFNYESAIEFVKVVKTMKHNDEYNKRRTCDLFNNISEIVLDWSISNQL